MIKSVEMTNWRAYDQYAVQFEQGLTFLMGPNGIGKTSILEAIAYAITGETATLPPKERANLLRDPGRPATVRLGLELEGESYLIERSQGAHRADAAHLFRAGSSKPLASSQSSVTEQVARLLGASPDFLRRILYMGEGDVFQFLKDPPGEALNLQIRRVLGLVQLDEFDAGLAQAERDVKACTEGVQDVLRTAKEVGAAGDLEMFLAECRAERDAMMRDLRRRQETLTSLRHQRAELEQLRLDHDQHQRLRAELEAECRRLSLGSPGSVGCEGVRDGVAQQREQIAALQQELGRAQGERAAYLRTQEVLGPQVSSPATLPCPICGKPLEPSERQAIQRNLQQSIQKAEEDASRIKSALAEAQDRWARMEDIERRIRRLDDALARSRESLSALGVRGEDVDGLRHELTLREEQMALETARLEELEEQLREQEAAAASYMVTLDRLKSLGFNSIEDARNDLVELETRSLTLRAARRAVEMTLAAQRNLDMAPVYEQIASIWSVFMPGEEWTVSFDAKGTPVVRNRARRDLTLSQLSGGEKTALLVVLHTVLAHYFARSSFLLIDEPLEHLDPVNRRSLIHFLVSACRRGLFQQAIITTYEESLIRKYLSDPLVHVVHVSPNQ